MVQWYVFAIFWSSSQHPARSSRHVPCRHRMRWWVTSKDPWLCRLRIFVVHLSSLGSLVSEICWNSMKLGKNMASEPVFAFRSLRRCITLVGIKFSLPSRRWVMMLLKWLWMRTSQEFALVHNARERFASGCRGKPRRSCVNTVAMFINVWACVKDLQS